VAAGQRGRRRLRRACEQHLYLQRQLREGLGKDKDRIDWVWLVDDTRRCATRSSPRCAAPPCCASTRAQLAQWLSPAPGRRSPTTCTWSTRWATG
jgi:hypothetical protein